LKLTSLSRSPSLASADSRGFSLVELLVSVAIGLVLTLILTSIIAKQEGSRRTLTSGNDLSSNTAYLSYMLDRELRSAGSGYAQALTPTTDPATGAQIWSPVLACPLTAARDHAQILPRATTFPEPFTSVPTAPILTPLLIHTGAGLNGSDVLAVTAGAAGIGETVISVKSQSVAAGQFQLPQTLGVRGGDLMLLVEAGRCMLQQVAPDFVGGLSPQVILGGLYASDNIGSMSLTTFATSAAKTELVAIGNVTGNTPRFQLFGLGANNALFSYDLLNLNGLDLPQPIVEGVVEFRALYGIANAAGVFTGWVAPTGAFSIGTLTNGSDASNAALKSIVAVRIGAVLRSDLVERDTVNKTEITLFSSLPGNPPTVTYTVPAGQERQRFRAVEFTVPLRNVILN
jgi:type IV pilus assembly protein PilW